MGTVGVCGRYGNISKDQLLWFTESDDYNRTKVAVHQHQPPLTRSQFCGFIS